MIKEAWGLKFDNSVAGVRVLAKDGKYYDIDINVYKKKLKLNPNNLKTLQLMEFGDLLMTEEEFSSGQIIEDASNNPMVLGWVQSYANKNNENDPKYQQKKKAKIFQYKQSYYSYLPTKWLEEFGEYHFNHFEGNKNIYTTLTKEQKDFVKEYFRWRSKLIFQEQKAPTSLRTKLNKAKKLVVLMGDAEDWQYDGTVDTGYMGGGVCELGHSLRYEHYAFSPSQSREIIFGATCMSDFFEVDKSVIDKIVSTQEYIMKEIKAIVFIMQTGKYEEYKKQTEYLWDVLKHFKGRFNDQMRNGAGWSAFMGGFEKLKLPLTRSMVKKYEELYSMYEKEKETGSLEDAYNRVLKHMNGYTYDKELVKAVMDKEIKLEIAHVLRDMLLMKDYGHPFVSKAFKLIPDLLKIQKKLEKHMDYPKSFLNKVKKEYPFVVTNDTRRLATKDEVIYKSEGITEEPYLGKSKTKNLNILMVCASNKVAKRPDRVPTNLSESAFTVVRKVEDEYYTIMNAIRWGIAPEFEKEISIFDTEIVLPGNAPDESVNKQSIRYRYDYIEENEDSMTDAERRRFFKIPTYNLDVSDEIPFINNVYNRILKRKGIEEEQPVQEEKKELVVVSSLDETLEEKLNRIIEGGATGRIATSHFAFKIIPTIKRTGRMTERQQKYIEDALNKI